MKASKVSADKQKFFTIMPHQSKLLLVLLILLAFTCGVLTGVTGHAIIPCFWGQRLSPTLSPSIQPEAEAILDPVNLQLIERVNDGITYLNTTLAIIGIMATLLGFALGLSIWKTHEHAIGLLDQHFLSFKVNQLEPILEGSRKELSDFRNGGIKLFLKASDILLRGLFQESQKMYKRLLEQKGMTGEALDNVLQNTEASFHKSKEITQFLLASLSQDEEIVIDVCHKLSAKHKSGISKAESDLILRHMQELLDTWGPGTEARLEIARLIDEIKRNANAER